MDNPSSPPNGPLTPWKIPDQDISTVELQLDRFYRARDGMAAWARVAAECVDFVEGRQITVEERNRMAEEGRPIIVLNKIRPLVRLVKGYFRQNRTDIKCKPGTNGVGMQAVADALNMTMKQIDEISESTWNNAEVFYDGIICGRGFFDTRLDFEGNVFGQVKETVQDPFSVYIDPEATSYAPKTWGYVQTGTWMSITDIQQIYGQAARELVDFNGGTFGQFPVRGDGGLTGTENDMTPLRSYGLDEAQTRSFDAQYFGAVQSYNIFDHINKERRLVRVIECQYKKWTKGPYILDMMSGECRPIPLHWTRERIAGLEAFCRQGNIPIQLAEGTYKRIRWTVSAADRVLYDDWSLYRDYTITPYYPYFRRGVTQGMVDDLLDPQREVNKRRSNMLHILTTMAHSGWMYQKGALDPEDEEVLEEEGARPGINVKYNKGFEAPQRIMPGIPSRGHELAGTEAADDLKQIAGISDSALGQLDTVQSGVAVQARQRQAVVGLEEYFENWDRSTELKGRVRLHQIQDYYTEPRIVRITGDDGKDKMTMLNAPAPPAAPGAPGAPPQIDPATGQPAVNPTAQAAGEIINDVTVGSYSIAIDKQPLAATFKDAQFQEAITLKSQGIPIPDDILVDLSSMPGKDIIKARIAQQQAAAAGGAPATPGQAPAGGAPPSSATPQKAPPAPPGQEPVKPQLPAPQRPPVGAPK